MLNYLCKGIPFNQIVGDLATKYEVKPDTIYQDWHRRERWINYVTQLDDPTVINELLQGLRQIIPNAWYEYKQADNTNAKIGALRVLRETYLSIIEVLQSMGKVERVAEKHVLAIAANLAEYEGLVEKELDRTLRTLNTTEQVDNSQANAETS
jgi:hypothetical protein